MSRPLPRLALVVCFAVVFVGCQPPAVSVCGNGKIEKGEECDDGNTVEGDSCSADCAIPVCGNGVKQGTEQCDDGNQVAGDGCERDCTLTPAGCGNGVREAGELCDDGNQVETDGCTKSCTFSASAAYCGDGTKGGTEACDDGNFVSGDGCEVDCTVTPAAVTSNVCGDGVRSGTEACDDGNQTNGDGCETDCTPSTLQVVTCAAEATFKPTDISCTVVPGGAGKLLVGTVLQPGRILKGGQVLIDASGAITCAACDCLAGVSARPTTLLCGDNVISAGLINSHDHLTYPGAPYVAPDTGANGLLTDGGVPERYEHRNDWRVGGGAHDGHTKVSNGGSGNGDQIRWNELRQLMAGTTSISGSGGALGLLRNLDAPDTSATGDNQQGLGANTAGSNYQTFPLGDSAGNELVGSCQYPTIPNPASAVPASAAYLPHIAEGIEASARNEFLCLANLQTGGANIFTARTSMIHGIGLKPGDVRFVKANQANLIWSARTNISLYGETAQIPVYYRMGVPIALGTDWVRSGSSNLLREFACVDYLNQNFYHRFLSDQTIWRMATADAARVQVIDAKAGVLTAGKVADVAIYRKGSSSNPYRSVLTAKTEDVLMTMRGGAVLYGDAAITTALGGTCEAIDVCGEARALCLSAEGTTYAGLKTANATTYPLFACNGPPQNEPVCSPLRGEPWLFSGANAYTSVMGTGDTDGDGIPDAMDNCPTVFNPKRPMDFGVQADADGDGVGDVCDVCPLDAAASTCSAPASTDWDSDGVLNAVDNCVTDPNSTQLDADADGKGDVCDPCPTQSNPGTQACPPTPGTLVSIYDIKALAGAYVGKKIELINVLITAVSSQGFFVQVHESETGYQGADYSGLFVYFPGTLPRTDVAPGDRVTILSAGVQDYQGQVQLSGLPSGSLMRTSQGNPLPAFTNATVAEVTTVARARALEGVLVQLPSPLTVADLAPMAGAGDTVPTNEFTVTETTGGPQLRIDDYLSLISPLPTVVGDTFTLLRGVLQYRNANYKLEPRSVFDVSRPVALANLGPSGAFVRVGQTDAPSFPKPIVVQLNSLQQTDTTIALTSSDAALVVPASVVVPAGQIAASVPLTGAAQATSVTLTATLGPISKTITVRVLGAAEVPTAVTLSPATLSVVAGQTGVLTATVDLPAPTGGTSIALTATGAVGTVPATVTVPENQVSVSVPFTATAATMGMSTVTATLGSSTASSTITVQTGGGANHVVISELQVAGATAGDEFVELYNPTNAAVDLSGWKLQYKSAAGAAYLAAAVTIPAGKSIAPHGFFLITSIRTSGFTGAIESDVAHTGPLNLAAAAGHVRIGPAAITTSPADPLAVDTVGYGVTASAPEGGAAAPNPAANSSIERKAYATSTDVSMTTGGDATEGNGQDSDNNAADFIVRPASQPQNSQSATEP